MVNHPNRSRHVSPSATSVTIKRILFNMIEYSVTFSEPMADDEARTYHANRYATFHGPHTGSGNARQINGPARTLWREANGDMLAAFREVYPNADVQIV